MALKHTDGGAYVMDNIRNLAGALAIGTDDRIHHGRFHSSLACTGVSGPRYPGGEWPPGSVSVVDSCQGAGIFQPLFGGPG
jgi:hypothetical protein